MQIKNLINIQAQFFQSVSFTYELIKSIKGNSYDVF